ncbi:Protein of unknown function [Pyronema omphalodes CBS 100304]|uniref:Uncharacterized protein n=1 Tax=Pyronema omphalodes (strain CBS 100304) TaxID=1076935 RepID=U4LHZ5_PYROM|nr:Protein of unknown function [Pyronema omphalodes CBS 100304]
MESPYSSTNYLHQITGPPFKVSSTTFTRNHQT